MSWRLMLGCCTLLFGETLISRAVQMPDTNIPFREGAIRVLAVSVDGKQLATGIGDIWDIPQRKKVVSGKTLATTEMNFSPDGKLLAVCGGLAQLLIFHSKNGELYWDLTLKGHGDTVVQDVEFTADGKYLLSSSSNGVFRVWEVATKTPYALYRFSGTNEYFNASYEEFIRAWRALAGNAPPDNVKQFVEFPNKLPHPGPFAVSPTETHLATPTCSAEVLILDWKSGKIEQTLKTRQPCTLSVAYSRDGKRIAIGGGDSRPDKGTCTIEVWDLVTGKPIQTLPGHRQTVLRMAFSPDGKTLASGGIDDGVRVWDLETGKEKFPPVDVYRYKGEGVRNLGLAFLPDNKTLLTLPDSHDQYEPVHFWDYSTGNRIPQDAPQPKK